MCYSIIERYYEIVGDSFCTNMKNRLNMKSVTLGVILGICLGKLWNVCKKTILTRWAQKSDIITDGLFFTPKKLACTAKCNIAGSDSAQNLLLPCNGCSLKHLISMLRKANTHLDICMYLITSDEICNIIIELFRNGVSVRIILDKHMSEDAYGADVVTLRKEYIPIKVIESGNLMHNKFAIIDREIVLSGSLNWTRQGLFGNYENVIILSNKEVAKKFTDYFQYLWNMKGP